MEWLKEHWIWAIFMVLAASALFSHFVLHLEWPKRVLTYVSVVLVAITYFTFFAATAVIMKILGKRLLPEPKEEQPTYWSEREKTEPTMEFMKKQG